MAKVTVAPHPELTKERAMEVFKSHFAGRYEVYKTGWGRGRDFMVEDTGTVGVAVTMKRGQKGTTFVFGATMPSTAPNLLLRAAFGLVLGVSIPTFGLLGLILIPALRAFLPTSEWRALEEEIKSFIETASEFN